MSMNRKQMLEMKLTNLIRDVISEVRNSIKLTSEQQNILRAVALGVGDGSGKRVHKIDGETYAEFIDKNKIKYALQLVSIGLLKIKTQEKIPAEKSGFGKGYDRLVVQFTDKGKAVYEQQLY